MAIVLLVVLDKKKEPIVLERSTRLNLDHERGDKGEGGDAVTGVTEGTDDGGDRGDEGDGATRVTGWQG